jgi:hypothetical protein
VRGPRRAIIASNGVLGDVADAVAVFDGGGDGFA